MKTLLTIANVPVNAHDDGTLDWIAGAEIDGDGGGSSHGDPDFESDTTLHYGSKPLNADEDRYIVVPPQVRDSVPGVVLGCQARAVNTLTGAATDAVVGDIGPHNKIGEMSIATAKAIGIPSSPTTGGVEDHILHYTIWPGKAAVVAGKRYVLTHSEA